MGAEDAEGKKGGKFRIKRHGFISLTDIRKSCTKSFADKAGKYRKTHRNAVVVNLAKRSGCCSQAVFYGIRNFSAWLSL